MQKLPHLVISLPLVVLSTGGLAFAQPLSPSQRQRMISKTGNTRESFDLIIDCNRTGQAKEVALFYHQLWRKEFERSQARRTPINPKIEAEFAFAWISASALTSIDAKESPQQKRLRKELDNSSAQAESCRLEASRLLPNDSGVLSLKSMVEANASHFQRASEFADRVVKQEPNWGNAIFWRGYMRMSLAVQLAFPRDGSTANPAAARQLYAKALADFHEAERLVPNLSAKSFNLYLYYIQCYGALQRYDKALVCIDRLIVRVNASKPVNTKLLTLLKRWRTRTVAKIKGE